MTAVTYMGVAWPQALSGWRLHLGGQHEGDPVVPGGDSECDWSLAPEATGSLVVNPALLPLGPGRNHKHSVYAQG